VIISFLGYLTQKTEDDRWDDEKINKKFKMLTLKNESIFNLQKINWAALERLTCQLDSAFPKPNVFYWIKKKSAYSTKRVSLMFVIAYDEALNDSVQDWIDSHSQEISLGWTIKGTTSKTRHHRNFFFTF
jgi:3-oxoacyl-(acyl-carrier-protein) synthase